MLCHSVYCQIVYNILRKCQNDSRLLAICTYTDVEVLNWGSIGYQWWSWTNRGEIVIIHINVYRLILAIYRLIRIRINLYIIRCTYTISRVITKVYKSQIVTLFSMKLCTEYWLLLTVPGFCAVWNEMFLLEASPGGWYKCKAGCISYAPAPLLSIGREWGWWMYFGGGRCGFLLGGCGAVPRFAERWGGTGGRCPGVAMIWAKSCRVCLRSNCSLVDQTYWTARLVATMIASTFHAVSSKTWSITNPCSFRKCVVNY